MRSSARASGHAPAFGATLVAAAAVSVLVVIPAAAGAQSGGPLGDLYRLREGGLAHYSSEDPTGVAPTLMAPGTAGSRRSCPTNRTS